MQAEEGLNNKKHLRNLKNICENCSVERKSTSKCKCGCECECECESECGIFFFL